jgi:type IV pilus assembly protein PilM
MVIAMGSQRILAIDIGGSHVAGGLFVAKHGRLTLERYAAESYTAVELSGERWRMQVGRALAALALPRSGTDANVMILPGHLVLAKSMRTPSASGEDGERIVASEAQENIPVPLEQVTWAHQVVGDDGNEARGLLLAARTEAVREVYEAATAAGFQCGLGLAGVMAVRESLRYNSSAATGPVVVVSVGARSTHLAFVANDEFRVRTLACGAHGVTAMVATELGIEEVAADEL